MLLVQAEAFLLALTLAAIFLASGMALGWLLAKWRGIPPARQPERQQITTLLGELQHWTIDVSSEVGEYRTLLESLTAQLADEAQRGVAPLPLPAANLLGQMLEAHRHLQSRLNAAESTLQGQADDIAAYMSQARTDALTGVSNRRVFDEVLASSLDAWNARGKPVAVILFDIDHFKLLNDTRGHLAGDAVLREMGRLLRDNVPRGGLIARYGGEEFACILGACEIRAAAEVAEHLRHVVESNHFLFERETLRVTMSCGAAQAMFREEGASLLKRCDSALYAAKSVGRNRVYWQDGYRCLPFNEAAAIAGAPAAAEEEPWVQDFQDVCQDLRERLSQLALATETVCSK